MKATTNNMPKLLYWKEIKKLSYSDLQKKTGISASSLCQIFTGKRKNLQMITIEKIAKGLDVKVKDLM